VWYTCALVPFTGALDGQDLPIGAAPTETGAAEPPVEVLGLPPAAVRARADARGVRVARAVGVARTVVSGTGVWDTACASSVVSGEGTGIPRIAVDVAGGGGPILEPPQAVAKGRSTRHDQTRHRWSIGDITRFTLESAPSRPPC
jgi:hypothetical protein